MLTNDTTSKRFHLTVRIGILLISILFLYLFLWFTYCSSDTFIILDFFYSNLFSYSLSLTLTPFSMIFSSLVSAITGIVFMYSYRYIGFYSNYKFFLLTTFGFVVSILIVINFTDIFMVMLGWDGLGVISFFLIVYYNSTNTVYSGLFTMLVNRVGDALLVLAISFLSITSSGYTSFHGHSHVPFFFLCILVLGFMTKSALFPFSPWLPAAISAPTPISSLVHSSTLVTAGLYLMLRFRPLLYTSPSLMTLLCSCSIFTTFYAGLNSLVEQDLKKLVALSTLSHLGFIGLAVSAGFESLALFHLFTHALFKSLIFISLGEIISSQSHYQDIRFLRAGILLTPESSSYIYISSLSLLGLPFVSGFYSKDIILESVHFSGSIGSVLLFLVYINLIFTYCYTSRILMFCTRVVKNTPYFNFSSFSLHTPYLVLLRLFSLLFGWSYLTIAFLGGLPLPVVPGARIFPTLLLIVVICLFILTLTRPLVYSPLSAAALGGMLFLSPINSNFSSAKLFFFINFITKTVEHGALNSVTLRFPLIVVSSGSSLIWYLLKSPLYMSILGVLFLVIFMCLL